MAEGEQQSSTKSWWQTVPGLISSLAAAVTAIAGLLVAIKQTGWFEPSSAPVASQASPPGGASQPSTAPKAASPRVVELPAMRDYQLGPESTRATFTLLDAQLSQRSSEKDSLRVQVRMTNHDRFDHPFWDRSFRLLINGGVPVAPESDLVELVPAQAAKEGMVIFSIPHGTPGGDLEINYVDDKTSIPLVFAAAAK